MPTISPKKPYRVGRSRTGLGLFATQRIKKGTKIIRYFGPLLDSKKKKDDAIENKYLFELNNRWTIDGSVRKNVARYINHACKPNAESDVKPRKRKVFIRAIKNIEPGDEINYDYGTDYFKAYLKPIGCKCAACEKKRKKERAEARAERARLKAKAERKAKKQAEKKAAKRAKTRAKAKAKVKARAKAKEKSNAKLELKPDRKRKLDSKASTVLNSRKPSRRGRPKSVATMVVVEQGVAATGEVSAIFQASNLALPAATVNHVKDEAQQASA
ncbi:MAG: SET domain-containing protein [Bradyrhizobium sp.]